MTTETPARSRFSAQELLPELGGITAALFKVTGNGSVPPTTVRLVGLPFALIGRPLPDMPPTETWT